MFLIFLLFFVTDKIVSKVQVQGIVHKEIESSKEASTVFVICMLRYGGNCV